MRREKCNLNEKVRSVIGLNKAFIESPLFEKDYSSINWFLNKNHIKEPYIKILRLIDQLPNNNFYLYKSNPVVEINYEKLINLFNNDNRVENSYENALDLMKQLTVLGLIRKISYENLLSESLNNNHLNSISLMKKNESHGTFLIIPRLDSQLLSRIFQDIEIKVNSSKENINTEEKNLEEPHQNQGRNDLRTKEEFYQILDYLHSEISSLDKLDAASEKYVDFINNEMDYTYTLLVSQCKLHKELDLSIKIGRPAFLWRLDQLKVKFKRMHAFKDVSFYLQRIECLVKLGLIKRVNFNQIEPEFLQFIDEKELKKKPDLYIFPVISSITYSEIANFKIDNFNRESKLNTEKENGSEIFGEYPQKGVENVISSSSLNSKSMKVERDEESEGRYDEVTEQNIEMAEKHKERIKYNLDRIHSAFFEEIYIPVNEYLLKNNLKIFYTKILKQILKLNGDFLEYKNTPIFYIDDRTLVSIYNTVFPQWVTNDEASKLFYSLIEIGVFEEVYSETVASDLKLNTQELAVKVRNKYSKNYKEDSSLYTLNRLNENVLKRVLSNIKALNEWQEIETISDDSGKKNQKMIVEKPEEQNLKSKNNSVDIDYSVTESALDILIESRIEGNNVIIDKYRFDKLIKAILGEVPDL